MYLPEQGSRFRVPKRLQPERHSTRSAHSFIGVGVDPTAMCHQEQAQNTDACNIPQIAKNVQEVIRKIVACMCVVKFHTQ